MTAATLEKLRTLHASFGPRLFGKAVQKLFALTFAGLGYRVVERAVQGVDVDAELAGSRYAIEVKTTEGLAVHLDDANVRALRARTADGYVPAVAALRLALWEDWLIAAVPLTELSPGEYLVDGLRVYRLRKLEGPLNPKFESMVSENFKGALDGGLAFLDRCLQTTGAKLEETQ